MIHLSLNEGPAGKLTVLCLGVHSDDIEIGCGGTNAIRGVVPKVAFTRARTLDSE